LCCSNKPKEKPCTPGPFSDLRHQWGVRIGEKLMIWLERALYFYFKEHFKVGIPKDL
jgi:hypothetical protein